MTTRLWCHLLTTVRPATVQRSAFIAQGPTFDGCVCRQTPQSRMCSTRHHRPDGNVSRSAPGRSPRTSLRSRCRAGERRATSQSNPPHERSSTGWPTNSSTRCCNDSSSSNSNHHLSARAHQQVKRKGPGETITQGNPNTELTFTLPYSLFTVQSLLPLITA